jgi:hypothetical protein
MIEVWLAIGFAIVALLYTIYLFPLPKDEIEVDRDSKDVIKLPITIEEELKRRK